MLNKFILVLFTLSIFTVPLIAQKEVLLIGTMHQAPKILKNSYKPLLKKAKKYAPEAIYVEVSMPDDNTSWEYLKNGYSKFSSEFYRVSDSLKTHHTVDEEKLLQLLNKPTKDLSQEELTFMIKAFTYRRDAANYKHYSYVKKHGVQGSKKPTRLESYDLVAKLALSQDIKLLRPTDDQQTNDQFHQHWRTCSALGDTKVEKKMSRKMVMNFIFPSLFGQYGTYTNNLKVLNYLHNSSSLRLAHTNDSDCTLATHFWDERNRRIALNLGTQITNNKEMKSILVIGASHIIGVKNELNRQFPDLKIILLNEVE